ncbi:MAG: hypothetical protein ABR863_11745 [Roseiarcus sp.]|jgi:hypothetical protein
MDRRQDANLRVGKAIAVVKAFQIYGHDNGANHRARDGQPYEVD